MPTSTNCFPAFARLSFVKPSIAGTAALMTTTFGSAAIFASRWSAKRLPIQPSPAGGGLSGAPVTGSNGAMPQCHASLFATAGRQPWPFSVLRCTTTGRGAPFTWRNAASTAASSLPSATYT